jgi:hypothetical protein
VSAPIPTPSPAPGWYADPAGTNRRRWWDGRAWTDYFADGGWDGTIEQQPLPAGARVNTVWIWIYVLTPVITIITSLLQNPATTERQALLRSPSGITETNVSFFHVGASGFLGIGLYALGVLMAALDWRELGRIGVVRPFHWAYAFIPAPVYIIGRTVVVRRRVHRGMAPMWTWIAIFAASVVIGVVHGVLVFATVMPQVLSSSNA